MLLSGLNRPGERHGTKYTYTAPGYRLKYKDMKDYRNETGRKLEILMEDKPTGLEVCSNIQFYDGISVIRSWTELKIMEKKIWELSMYLLCIAWY